jgi:NAD dependent epimerase/dehydratase family enzyme
VNLVAPDAVTNAEFTKTLGRVLRRPAVLPVPAFALRLLLGEVADQMLLASTRVRPSRLLDSGYRFRHPRLEAALRHLLGRG